MDVCFGNFRWLSHCRVNRDWQAFSSTDGLDFVEGRTGVKRSYAGSGSRSGFMRC
ncbi:hypothetical protein Pan110_00320 [Gimesia panareensis]|nr:hypothetical protein Pan110_00320 [Gimesia panareensis]